MMGYRYVRIVLILGMVAVMCGTVSAVAVGVVAETQATSGAQYPVCTAPCECISESTAAMRWGAEGYDMCSKTICGQSADAMVQYYCIHQAGSAASAVTSAPAVITTATVTASQGTVSAVFTTAATVAAPSPALLETGAVTRKTPVGIVTILAAIGAVLLVKAGVRRK